MTLLSPERLISGIDHIAHPRRHVSRTAPGSVLVPVDGSNASMQGMRLATAITPKDKLIRPVYIVTPARRLPLDADLIQEANRGEDILTQAEQIAVHEDKDAQGDLLQARSAGEAIKYEADKTQASVVVIGVEENKYSESGLGKTAEFVLREAVEQTVILDRAPLEDAPVHPSSKRIQIKRQGKNRPNQIVKMVRLLSLRRFKR